MKPSKIKCGNPGKSTISPHRLPRTDQDLLFPKKKKKKKGRSKTTITKQTYGVDRKTMHRYWPSCMSTDNIQTR